MNYYSITAVFDETLRVAEMVAMLGQVRRATRHRNGEPESVTTHSVMLALTVLSLADAVRYSQEQAVEEAVFVHFLDKAMPRITHEWNACRVPREAGMSLDDVKERVSSQLQELWRESVRSLRGTPEAEVVPPSLLAAADFVRYLNQRMVAVWPEDEDDGA